MHDPSISGPNARDGQGSLFTQTAESNPLPNPSVSENVAKVWFILKKTGDWMTNSDIVSKSGVLLRNVRFITARLFARGVLERAPTHPGHHFRVVKKLDDEKGQACARALDQALSVFKVH